MIDICPTITAKHAHEYREQMERIVPFATRIHIDIADGVFTPHALVPVDQIWWPGGVRADIHVMYQQPFDHLDALVALGPQLVIVHAEAEGDFLTFAKRLHHHGIETGVALLPTTEPEVIRPGLEFIDHVCIFSGNLGRQGGSIVDFNLLDKVAAIKALKPTIEIGWDGGVNDQNIKELVDGGIEVVNVGGYIQSAHDAQEAYHTLQNALR